MFGIKLHDFVMMLGDEQDHGTSGNIVMRARKQLEASGCTAGDGPMLTGQAELQACASTSSDLNRSD